MANRLRIHDPDFSAEDLTDTSSDPQWFQELTNNYRKLYLNNVWHLLPQSTTDTETTQHNTDNNQTLVDNFNSLNIQAKNEPKTAHGSPMHIQKNDENEYDSKNANELKDKTPLLPVQQPNNQPVISDNYNLNYQNFSTDTNPEYIQHYDQMDHQASFGFNNYNNNNADAQPAVPFYSNHESYNNNSNNELNVPQSQIFANQLPEPQQPRDGKSLFKHNLINLYLDDR